MILMTSHNVTIGILLVSLLQLSAIIATDSPLKKHGSVCFRDEECVSQCCYTQTCMDSTKECAQQRMELLTKITEHIDNDPLLS